MTNLQECLSYLSDIDFDRETLKAAREELASIAQRANAALPPPHLAQVRAEAWNEAVEAAAQEADKEDDYYIGGPIARRIRALKRTA